MPLAIGQSLSIDGNSDEIDTTVYNISMGASTTATCIVIKKENQ